MHALILAAGAGTRLGLPLPKALQKVGGVSILGRTLDNLAEMGFAAERVKLVTGYREELFRNEGIELIHNPLWRFPGTLSSFLAAGDVFEEVLIIHGDLIWEKGLLESLEDEPGEIVVPVDPRNRLREEGMKAEVRDGNLLVLSKKLPLSRSAGESMGVFLVRRPRRLVEISEDFLWKPQASIDDAVNAAAGELEVRAFPTETARWIEVDTEADLTEAGILFP